MFLALRYATVYAGLVLLLTPSGGRAEHPAPPAADYAPDPASVQRYHAGYRYPQAGWIVLHIEGEPYERGFQHGRLLSREIVDYISTLAADRSARAPADAWREIRLIANALFLRKYDAEYLEEMKGIADGAAAAGAKFDSRALDLVDIVAVNSSVEIDFLETGLDALPTGLEGKKFIEPPQGHSRGIAPEHCSAFAATGPATADGKIVFGHITMWNLAQVRHLNVWLDVKPAKGHRVLMQSYPGGIMSGMDYYLNDAGLLVAETTIHQTRFNIEGAALCSRIRRVMQYADTIDGAIEVLAQSNNGLYSNEWLLGDTKTNEIAMFELGTHKQRLWRSSRQEWIAGTEGFYWGCNNARDLDVRLETVASVSGKPANVLFRPSDRDKTWISLYRKHKGKIAAGFGFEAFTTPPLAAFPSCDAKFTTSALAGELKTWALFGPPLGKTWDANPKELREHPGMRPLVGNDWTLLTARPPLKTEPQIAAVDLSATPSDKEPAEEQEAQHKLTMVLPAAWHGTLLPAADADVWLAAGFSDLEKIVALEKSLQATAKGGQLSEDDADRLAVKRFAPRSHYLAAVHRLGRDVPLAETTPDPARNEWFDIAAGKGTLLLDQLRDRIGAKPFEALMDQFGRTHAGQSVSTDEFIKHVHEAAGGKADGFFDPWLKRPLVAQGPRFEQGLLAEQGPFFEQGRPPGGGSWAIDSFEAEPELALIIYGTLKEKDAQQESALLLQRKIARRWCNCTVPVVSDTQATESDLGSRHLLLIGRPDSNRIVARCAAALPIAFGPCSFKVRGKTYANPESAVVASGGNPLNPRYSVVAFAGLGADATWHIPSRLPDQGGLTTEVLLLPAGGEPKSLIVSVPALKEAGAKKEAEAEKEAGKEADPLPAKRAAGKTAAK